MRFFSKQEEEDLLLLPPLLCRTASPGSMDYLTWCFRCWSYCSITEQSLLCPHWICQPSSISTALQHSLAKSCVSSLPSLAFLSALLKTCLLFFCPCCPTTFLSLHSSRRSLVVHSQPSSSHYCPNKKNYTQHMACAVTPCLSQSRHCQYQTAVLHVSFISSLMCKPLCCSSLLCIKVICGARKYLYNLYLEYQNYTWISTCLLTSSIYHENKSIIDVPMTTRSRRGQSHSRLQGY